MKMFENKEIEEMTTTVFNCLRDENGCKNCKYFNGSYCTSVSSGVAEALYNADYRNADNVRKETAREILDYFDRYAGTGKKLIGNMISEQRKKYGVEVEE